MIRRLRLTVTLQRSLPVGTDNLEADPARPRHGYDPADRIGARVLRVKPVAGSAQPQVAQGDVVEATWTVGATTERRLDRIVSVTPISTGTVTELEITGAADENIIPPGTTGITVTRLDATTNAAERIDDRILRVHPLLARTRVDMPRFVTGDLVERAWTGASTRNRTPLSRHVGGRYDDQLCR